VTPLVDQWGEVRPDQLGDVFDDLAFDGLVVGFCRQGFSLLGVGLAHFTHPRPSRSQ
jgi:hypothetical protein